ncbi:MAG: GTP pyrophosphokinase family protein [Clostridia bacterium]|nr:GTP pyrophosphokinase family protein [Clostridia bacterium]
MQMSDKSELAMSTDLTLNADAAKWMQTRARQFMEIIVDYKELRMMYTCAMKEIQTKFDILNTEFKVRYSRNPIASISTRLKTTASIAEKLSRYNCGLSVENIEKYIHDVGGVRVICSYIDDIYLIADALLEQDDITLLRKKDYIAEPKPNGYRSLHLIVTVPVFFADHKIDMKVEVQIRTIAMDFWASLEHQMKYKQEIPDQEAIAEELRLCAETIRETDERMLAIRRKIEAAEDTADEEDLLFEKLSRIDIG